MLSFPFNSSTTVFYYNQEVFEKAGLDPKRAPATWPEVMAAAAKIKAAGAAPCSFTTAWQSWVQLESFSAWHNMPFATKENGFGGNDAKLLFNGPLQVKHIGNMQDWAKKGYFTYAGRKTEPEAKFYSGECAMLTTSSAAYGTIKQNAKFRFTVAPLPYYADVAGAPQNTIIGGASLWVMGGKSKDEYKAVAKFFKFLSDPERAGGVAPDHGLPADHAGGLRAHEEVRVLRQEPRHRRLGQADDRQDHRQVARHPARNFVQIRDIIDEELEGVWSGKKTARKRSTPRSRAATSRSSGSRRRPGSDAAPAPAAQAQRLPPARQPGPRGN